MQHILRIMYYVVMYYVYYGMCVRGCVKKNDEIRFSLSSLSTPKTLFSWDINSISLYTLYSLSVYKINRFEPVLYRKYGVVVR